MVGSKEITDKHNISVIVPVYNAENYIVECLNSILAQESLISEVLVVDDGSLDGTAKLIQGLASDHPVIKLISQQNHGQGYARNKALKIAAGDYILFVDADDTIDANALTVLLDHLKNSTPDIIHFGWKASQSGTSLFKHADSYLFNWFTGLTKLEGPECDRLLQIPDYFSVNNLYRRDFLLRNKVFFGEGYIYEDNEFMVKAATTANTITFINEALYVVRFSHDSSSRSALKSDKHAKDFLEAIRKSYSAMEARLPETNAYLAHYFLEKFTIYYQQRVPLSLRREYLRSFVDEMSKHPVAVLPQTGVSKFLKLCVMLRVFTNKRYLLFYGLVFYKTRITP